MKKPPEIQIDEEELRAKAEAVKRLAAEIMPVVLSMFLIGLVIFVGFGSRGAAFWAFIAMVVLALFVMKP